MSNALKKYNQRRKEYREHYGEHPPATMKLDELETAILQARANAGGDEGGEALIEELMAKVEGQPALTPADARVLARACVSIAKDQCADGQKPPVFPLAGDWQALDEAHEATESTTDQPSARIRSEFVLEYRDAADE